MYVLLAERYGYTPEEVANMTYEQQSMLLRGKSVVTFQNMRDYFNWMAKRGSE